MDVDLPVEQLIDLLNCTVQDAVHEYERIARTAAVISVALGGFVLLGGLLLGLSALPAAVVALVMSFAGLVSVRFRGPDLALWRYGPALQRYTHAVAGHLTAMPREGRLATVESWQLTQPLAVAWIEGNWSARVLVE